MIMRASASRQMKRTWGSLEQVRRNVSIAGRVCLSLAQSGKPNTHPGSGNVQSNQLHMCQTVSDFLMKQSDGAFRIRCQKA